MKASGRALRLSIFVGEDDQWHHKPLYCEIVHRAHMAGLAGATVLRGIEGFGANLTHPHAALIPAEPGSAGRDRPRRRRGPNPRLLAATGRPNHQRPGGSRRGPRHPVRVARKRRTRLIG